MPSEQDDSGTTHYDGHEYENVSEFDLREDFDRFAFGKKLDLFMDWFDDADEVMAEEEQGHRHFIVGQLEVKCNVEKESDRIRRIYHTVGDAP